MVKSTFRKGFPAVFATHGLSLHGKILGSTLATLSNLVSCITTERIRLEEHFRAKVGKKAATRVQRMAAVLPRSENKGYCPFQILVRL